MKCAAVSILLAAINTNAQLAHAPAKLRLAEEGRNNVRHSRRRTSHQQIMAKRMTIAEPSTEEDGEDNTIEDLSMPLIAEIESKAEVTATPSMAPSSGCPAATEYPNCGPTTSCDTLGYPGMCCSQHGVSIISFYV